MLCKQCGYYAAEEAIVCPQCGTLLREEGAAAAGAESIRQGKRAREAIRNRQAQVQEEIRRKRRSGASHATIPLPPVKDTRTAVPEYFDPMADDLGGIGEEQGEESETFERRKTEVYSLVTIQLSRK